MIFTDNPVLIELGAQINRLLTNRQKIKADYTRAEMSSKKMLSNISHDIKTPLTVLLGYLEIIRLAHKEDEMLKKAEVKAKQVMELINQFFTLAKLEAKDTDIILRRINICEVCRENVLEFYDILLLKEFQVDLSIPEESLFVQADTNALQRILYNLLSNVIRYGSDGKYLGALGDLVWDGCKLSAAVVGKRKFSANEFVCGDAVIIKHQARVLKSDVKKDGRVIIRRGTSVTPEVLEKARKEGEYIQTNLKTI